MVSCQYSCCLMAYQLIGIGIMVIPGLEAWASEELRDFGQLMSASGLSSIKNYECGTTYLFFFLVALPCL